MNTTLALMPTQTSKPLPLENLSERILDAFPSGSYALSALLRLMDIVESVSVPTAAVECRVQPRLLVNPDFVARHADTSEKLLILVMHELHHVLLGHTTLFPRVTKVQNFVFDAVINGIVCRMFSAKEHTTFFTDYYDAASFPMCLLRPPPGWPAEALMAVGIAALPKEQRKCAQDIHTALYSDAGASYQEVYEVLPKLLVDLGIGDIALLGGHQSDDAAAGQLEQQSPVLFDIVRSIVEQWPQPPDPIRGRSLADVLRLTTVRSTPIPSNRHILRSLIRKVAGLSSAGSVRRLRMDTMEVPSPIPCLDRRSMVLRCLGVEPLLHTHQVPWRHSVRSGERVHVYLDVSGSMDAIKGPLYGAVLDCESLVHPSIHLFSTKVADVSLAEMRRGVCKSDGGTDIDCVAAHIAANRVRRALLITDGWVGAPEGQHEQTLRAAQLAVAYLGDNTNQKDLESVANQTAKLFLGASA